MFAESLEDRTVLSRMFSGMAPIADEVVVQFTNEANVQQRAMVRHLGGFGLADEIASAQRLNMGHGMMEVVKVPAGMTSEEAVAWLQSQPGVSFAEVNMTIAPTAVSNDPYYTTSSRLWGMYGSDSPSPVGPSGTKNQFGIHAENAWNAGHTGSSSVYVGIIDEGVQVTHPDLVNNVWVNPYDPVDGIDNDGNGYVDDTHGWDFVANDRSVYDGTADDHGTHVAGTIGAQGGNGTGVAGVTWDVTMIVAKFLGTNGGTLTNAVRAIDYVTDLKVRHGLNIVATNNSWGGGGYSQALHEAILRSAHADILFVAAAGNSAVNNDAANSYPSNYSTLTGTANVPAAGYESVIAVAAITSSGALWSSSNYGATRVDLGAPGAAVNSTVPNNGYASYSGTSMATPHVTGSVALLKSIYPSATAEQLRTAILGSTTATASLAGKTVTGGRLNVFAAISHPALNAQPPQTPSVTIADASKTEGNTGTSNLVFTVTLSNASNEPVSLVYATADGTATAGSDYAAASGTLTIPAGATSGTVSIAVYGDYAIEANETFQVEISSATNATIADGTAVGTIVNDDAAPVLSIANVTREEGDSGTANMVFTVTMSNAVGVPMTVDYSTFDITATAGVDYLATVGTLTIPAGSTSATIAVPIVGDTDIEANETFEIRLSNASGNATIASGTAVGTILTDDFETVSVSVADASVTEGNSGWRNMNFVVTLSSPSAANVTVFYATAGGTATSGSDFEAKSGILTIQAGQTSGTVTVRIKGDKTVETDETLYLNLTNSSANATIVRNQATGTIVNDDNSGGRARGKGGDARGTGQAMDLVAAPIPELDFVLNEWTPRRPVRPV